MDPNDQPEVEEPLRAAEHGSLPVSVPDLTHLTTAEVLAFKSYILLQTKDARKKSSQILSKNEALRKLWTDTLSVKGEGDRRSAIEIFQKALVRFPAAYLAYAYVTSLFVIDEAIRAEMKRRSQNT